MLNSEKTGNESGTLWEIEAWRGIAAWLVVYAHYWSGESGGLPMLRFAFTGVDLFFVLSGCVFGPHLFGHAALDKQFAVRRFFRIYPMYLLALLLYMAMKAAQGGALSYVTEHLLFAHLQSREMTFYYNPVFWSLPAEVEFYALLPLFAWVCGLWRHGWGVLLCMALILRLALGYASDAGSQNFAFIAMHHVSGMLVEFLMGAVVWRVSRGGLAGRTKALLVFLGIGLWCGLASWFGSVGGAGIDSTLARGQMSWLAALAFAAMVCGTLGTYQNAPVWLVRSALWAGRLSYGVYLFHIAALRLAEQNATHLGGMPVTVVATALTLLVAWLCYLCWENPWRRFGRRLFQKTSVSPG